MHLGAGTVTWLGGRNYIFADIIKTSWIGWVLNPTSVLGSEEQRREKGHVKAEAATSEGTLRIPASPQARRLMEPSQHSDFRLSLQNCERIKFLLF